MPDTSGWWQEFFSGPVLEFVLHSRDQAQTRAEADFVQQCLGISPGRKVLDIPCGGGRLALEMARRGYQVTAVDLSPQLLDTARSHAEAEGLQVDWERRDMRHLPWQWEFDGAYCFWSSFGYFDEQGNADFLKAVSDGLKPGARFVMDTPLIETRLPEMEAQERLWWPVGELLALEERNYDHVTSRVESRWTFVHGGRVEHRELSIRLYTYRELCQLLEGAGFGHHRAYSSLDWEPFGLGCTWLYMVTTKLGA